MKYPIRLALVLALVFSIPPLEARELPEYPSHRTVPYKTIKIKPGDTPKKLFGAHWEAVARFNRMDPERFRAGLIVKIPLDLEAAESYSPLPQSYKKAFPYKKYVVVDIGEQFLGAYENGKLAMSMPVSSADPECLDEKKRKEGCWTPVGEFEVLAFERDHVSNIYTDAVTGNNARMPYAVLFFLRKTERGGSMGYWIHGGDLPGHPDSHGCIRVAHKNAKGLFVWLGGDPERSEALWRKPGIPVEVRNNPLKPVEQGDVLLEEVASGQSQKLNVYLERKGKKIREGTYFWTAPGISKVIMPIGMTDKLGRYALVVRDAENGELLYEQELVIRKGRFPKDISTGWRIGGVLTGKAKERRDKEIAEMASVYGNPLEDPLWPRSLGFEFPVEKGLPIFDKKGKPAIDSRTRRQKMTGEVTHEFGEIRFNPKVKKSRRHFGTDIRAPEGFPVKAIADGRVALAAYNPKTRRGYFSLEGNLTIIDHGGGLFSLYLHQKEIFVKTGDVVQKGQIIGAVGDTGNSIGSPHLHLAIKIKGERADAIKFLKLFGLNPQE